MSESFVHKDIKIDIYWDRISQDSYAAVEKSIGCTRTDILTEVNGCTLAIELQHTSISVKSILKRMREHTINNTHTLWLITPEALAYDSFFCKNLKWVLFIQTMQNGVIFLPTTSSKVIPARVDNTLTLSKNELATGKKYLEVRQAVDLADLTFTTNYDYNIVSYPEWWVDTNSEWF